MDKQENNRERYRYLAEKWLAGALTPAEREEFDSWYNYDSGDDITIEEDQASSAAELKERLLKKIRSDANIPMPTADTERHEPGDDLKRIIKDEENKNKDNRLRFRRIYLEKAAIWVFVLLLLGVTGYYIQKPAPRPVVALRPVMHTKDVLPGSEKAVLTLAGGRRILLDNTARGIVAIQGNCKIAFTGDGELTYQTSAMALGATIDTQLRSTLFGNNAAQKPSRPEIHNTLSTPKGALYHLTLSDGTKVWLNAASSITYPVHFNADERRVSIKGEAYFEVAKNAAKPFKVSVDDMLVTVLGTHFNVNAYKDASTISTTLLEGAVNVQNLRNGDSRNIRPGQQAKLLPTSQISVASVNTDIAVAWKNGLFQFEKADLHSLLNEVARWYNIQVEWKGDGTPDLFTGTIPRNLKLSELLSVLDYANVRFKLEDNRLTVYT